MNLENIINLSAVFSIYAINELKDGLGGREMVDVQTSVNIELFPAFILL
jgi:hypothetical protein